MKVIREKSILEKINDEIRDNTKPTIVRIDLNSTEFTEFLHSICEGVIGTNSQGELIRLKPEQSQFVTGSNVRYPEDGIIGFATFKGSYVVYKGVCIQCCYEEE